MSDDGSMNYCPTCRALTASNPYERMSRCHEHDDCIMRVVSRQCATCYLTKTVNVLHAPRMQDPETGVYLE